MIIKLDWFGCRPNASWETQIHQILQILTETKPISRASLRVEQDLTSPDPFHMTLMLSMPGPDVIAHGRGHSFQNALQQVTLGAQVKLSQQAVGRVRTKMAYTSAALSVALLIFSQATCLGNIQSVLAPKSSAFSDRQERHFMEHVAPSIWSMTLAGSIADTHVWPHGGRDRQARLGDFLCSSMSLLPQFEPADEKERRAWVLLGLSATVKYFEGSDLGHIAYTDSTGMIGENCYYYSDISDVRLIHRSNLSGSLRLKDDACDAIFSNWVKVTADHALCRELNY